MFPARPDERRVDEGARFQLVQFICTEVPTEAVLKTHPSRSLVGNHAYGRKAQLYILIALDWEDKIRGDFCPINI